MSIGASLHKTTFLLSLTNFQNILIVDYLHSYYKNVRKEWASLVSAPSTACFPDALAFTRSLGDLHLQTYGSRCDVVTVFINEEKETFQLP